MPNVSGLGSFPKIPNAPRLPVKSTNRRDLQYTQVSPPSGPPRIGPTYRNRGDLQMSESVPGAEILPMDLPMLLAMLPLRRNELALDKARSLARDKNFHDTTMNERYGLDKNFFKWSR